MERMELRDYAGRKSVFERNGNDWIGVEELGEIPK